jgi:hypothetical protein
MSEREPDPDELTSPGTVDDPELERQRADEALERELESRAEPETKFEQQRRAQEADRADLADDLNE